MKKAVIIDNGVGSNYLNQLDELSEIRKGFEMNTLRNSNKELYQILAKVYLIFENMNKNKSELDINLKFV